MLSFPVIKQTSLSMLFQPTLLLASIVEIAVLLFLIFGIHFEVEQDTLLSIRLLGSEIDQIALFLHNIVPNFVSFLAQILMFLFIVGSSNLYPELLKDPLLGVMLTKPLSRVNLFLSKYVGMVLGVSINIVMFSLFFALILSIKHGGTLFISPVIGALAFLTQYIVISAICSLFAILTESVTAVAVLGVGIYFLLGPLLSSTEMSTALLVGISLIVPKTGKLMEATRELLMGGQADAQEFLIAAIPAVIFFTIAAVLFNRRDL